MKLNIKEFLQEAEISEAFYPGKRLVKTCRQPGEYKSHCVVLDWRDPDKIRIEIKAGLSGRDMDPKKLKYYPVCFQSPSHIDIEIVNDNEEDEEKGKASGKGGSGGKGMKKKDDLAKLSDMKQMAASAFGSVMDGNIPALGNIVDMVIMGSQISKNAYGAVMGALAKQLQGSKVVATELLASAGNFITKYTPPSFMKPTGDETAQYKYDREKNADIGYRKPSVG